MCKLDENKFEIILANYDDLKNLNFDCGDEDLNEFLLEDSFENLSENLCAIFLCAYEEEIIAFFSLSADSIKINDPLPIPYKYYPAVKIGRLGVKKEYHNNGVGSFLLKWIYGYCKDINGIGVRFISVDAYNLEKPLRFYKKNKFTKLIKSKYKDTVPMYKDLKK
ncbi:MAG: GNAT family N-acetyltransferase [Methanobrevibacter ruminantium]|uniref:GNAT family N-acetyltransferase n=1 Tax=Methanobrevibacter ruminantium TaxID=83816 RepID=UPI0026F0B68F|nr:GNAT family N-acetyltransferase [Methanobrevibacter ruminantium]MDD6048332.1 GNAT family N-acetyltransferase [Methanobrevibacter ruminantium]MDO5842600.1 GNAT family N-acetyltransferase [Methanobrevibacter ruminantium]